MLASRRLRLVRGRAGGHGAVAARRRRSARGVGAIALAPRRRWRSERAAGFDEAAPVLERFRRAAVDLEPHQRFLKRPAMHQRALRARRRFEIHQAPLHRENLPQPLGVAAGDRQHANPQRRLLGRPAPAATPATATPQLDSSSLCIRVVRVIRRRPVDAIDRPAARHQAERHEQRAEQHGVGETFRRRRRIAGGSDRAPRAPATARPRARAAVQLRRDRLEQPVLGQQPERLLGSARPQHLVVLLDQARRRGVGDQVPMRRECASTTGGSRRKPSRAANATARNIRTGSS